MTKYFCCRPIASLWSKNPIRLQWPIRISLIYLIVFEPPGVKLTIQGKKHISLGWTVVYDTNLFSIKKETLPSGFFTNHHTSGSPSILPHCQIHKSHHVYFWWGLDIFLHKYHIIIIIQQCQDIGLIVSAKYIKILLLLGLATPHAKKLYFLCSTFQYLMYLFDWSINGRCNLNITMQNV